MTNNSQSGSAIIWILIAVALFAAIGVAMMSNSRTSTSMITDEQTRAYANQIIGYGNEVKSAVKRLQLRGCTDTQISFENNIVSGYDNTNTPPDSCKLFNVNGGGLQWGTLPGSYAVSGGDWDEGKFYFVDGTAWEGNGTTCGAATCTDLIMLAGPLDETLCAVLNEQLGYDTAPGDTNFGGDQFTGTYTLTYNLADEAEGESAESKSGGCFLRDDDDAYIYVHLLLAR